MENENNPPISFTHNQSENPFRIKNTIKNPKFFVIDKISSDYNTNHNKK